MYRRKIYFSRFWSNFNTDSFHAYHNGIFKQLVDTYSLIVTNESPDIIICNCGEVENGIDTSRSTFVYYTGERLSPNMNNYHYAMSFDHSDNPRHFRFPLYLWNYADYLSLTKPKSNVEQLLNRRFCNFVYSNGVEMLDGVSYRNNFFRLASGYKQVDAGGSVLNNIGHKIENKREFQSQYKFTIAMENRSHPGYTTEKIIDAYLAKSIPIYFGNENVDLDFNPDSMINANKFSSQNELLEYVKYVDNTHHEYIKIITANPIPHPLPRWGRWSQLCEFWEKIIFS